MNKENLLKLAKFLDSLPEDYKHFDMADWVACDTGALCPDELEGVDIGSCGYAACAIGHAPQALGLSIEETNMIPIWNDFIDKYFDIDYSPQEWMFGYDWKEVDNTPQGVAKRIRYFLENGVPEEFNAYYSPTKELIEFYKGY
jgi:hypothetical protein|tara:strand:- start:26 stop:454 length:429 start_codon:yes stop_codon:yes gene_type:complete